MDKYRRVFLNADTECCEWSPEGDTCPLSTTGDATVAYSRLVVKSSQSESKSKSSRHKSKSKSKSGIQCPNG